MHEKIIFRYAYIQFWSRKLDVMLSESGKIDIVLHLRVSCSGEKMKFHCINISWYRCIWNWICERFQLEAMLSSPPHHERAFSWISVCQVELARCETTFNLNAVPVEWKILIKIVELPLLVLVCVEMTKAFRPVDETIGTSTKDAPSMARRKTLCAIFRTRNFSEFINYKRRMNGLNRRRGGNGLE